MPAILGLSSVFYTGKEPHMATISQPQTSATPRDFPRSSVRFDWIVVLLEAWWVGGLFVDGWAHEHGKVDQSFFTPWHAILYSGFFCQFPVLCQRRVEQSHQRLPLEPQCPAGL